LEDDEDATTKMSEDSPRQEWWEEVEHKAKEEEGKMLKEQEALLESFAAATAQVVCADLAAYRSMRSFLSEDSPRLRAFGRPLWIGSKHHALRKVRAPPPPSSSSPRTTRSDVLC
jgi:hypothetical protein